MALLDTIKLNLALKNIARYFPNETKELTKNLNDLRSTCIASLFFDSFRGAIQILQKLSTEKSASTRFVREMLSSLENERDGLVKSFIDRCAETGTLDKIENELDTYKDFVSDENRAYLDGMKGSPRQTGKYIYCSISFGDGRTYYYRTTDPTYTKGDRVVVPTYSSKLESIGYIVKVEHFTLEELPVPLNRTKRILRLAESDKK